MKPKVSCTECGMVKNAGIHGGTAWEHDFNPPPTPGFGQRPRQPLNPRSDRMRAYYADVRVPAIVEAVGDGKRPCTMRTPDCTGWVETLHEPATRGRFGGLQSAVEAGGEMPCCNPCNFWVKKFPIRAREMGLLRSNTVDGTRAAPRMPPRRQS